MGRRGQAACLRSASSYASNVQSAPPRLCPVQKIRQRPPHEVRSFTTRSTCACTLS